MLQKRLLLFGLVFVILGGTAAAILVSKKPSPQQKVADSFVSYAFNGDHEKSYKLFDEAAKTTTSESQWKTKVAKISPIFKNSSAKLQKASTITAKTSQSGGILYEYKAKGTDGTYKVEILILNNKNPTVLNFSSKRESKSN